MEPESKMKKMERTTPDQLRYYIDFVKNHPQMITGKNCPTSKKMLDDLWKEVADGLNSMRGPSRDHLKWKESLQIWKNQIRCRARKHKAHMLATGGGSGLSRLSEFEEMALSVLGAEAVTGVNYVEIIGFGETSVEDRSRTDHITQVEAVVVDAGDRMDGGGTIDVGATKDRFDTADGDAFDILGEEHNLQTTDKNCSPESRPVRKRHLGPIYDKIMQSIETRNCNEEKLIEGITLMAAATEKFSSSIKKLADCIEVLTKFLQKHS